eukprot:1043614-Pelagomonas_calceolata.AAC.2
MFHTIIQVQQLASLQERSSKGFQAYMQVPCPFTLSANNFTAIRHSIRAIKQSSKPVSWGTWLPFTPNHYFPLVFQCRLLIDLLWPQLSQKKKEKKRKK